MPVVALGNTAPVVAVKDGDETTSVTRVPRPDLGRQVTSFAIPDNVGVGEALQIVSAVFASHHSDEKPAWVESDDEVFASALSREFGCPIGRPNDWENGTPVEKPAEETPAETPAPQVETQTVTAQDVAPAAAVVTPTPAVQEATA